MLSLESATLKWNERHCQLCTDFYLASP